MYSAGKLKSDDDDECDVCEGSGRIYRLEGVFLFSISLLLINQELKEWNFALF